MGWSVRLSSGLTDLIWSSSEEGIAEGIKKIFEADSKISKVLTRTSTVSQSSRYVRSDEEFIRLGQATSSIWDDYYTNTARLLRSMCPAKMSMMWGRAGADMVKIRRANSNLRCPATTDKAIWDRLRAARRDRRALHDNFICDPDPLQQNAELLYQAYFFHSDSIADGLQRYSVDQDSNWYLAKDWARRGFREEAGEAGEKALRATLRLIDNFHDALRPTTLRLLSYCNPRVPPGQWTKPPTSIRNLCKR